MVSVVVAIVKMPLHWTGFPMSFYAIVMSHSLTSLVIHRSGGTVWERDTLEMRGRGRSRRRRKMDSAMLTWYCLLGGPGWLSFLCQL